MSDTPNFTDLENYRYNSFTNTITPKQIGYGANPAESRTIPSTTPYRILLHEAPQQNTPSTTEITDTTTSTILEEVSKTTTPGNNQYRINYDERGLGQVEFNENQKGHSISIKYFGEGSINKVENLQATLETITLSDDIINNLYVDGSGDIIFEKSRVLSQTINEQNLGAISSLAANEWYFVVVHETNYTVSLQRLSTLSPATFPASWSPTLATDQLDLIAFFDLDKNFSRYDVISDFYRIVWCFETDSTPADIFTKIKIPSKAQNYLDMEGVVVAGQTISQNNSATSSSTNISGAMWVANATTNTDIIKVPITPTIPAANFICGVYTDNGSGYPATKIAEIAEITLSSANVDIENMFKLVSPVMLVKGKFYWLVWAHSAGTLAIWDADQNNRQKLGVYVARTYDGTLPATFPGGGTAWNKKALSLISGQG
jgi:hypothetical protein